MAVVEVIHKEHDGTTITSAFTPENLNFTLNKGENGPHNVQYEISRSRSIVGPDFVGPYRTDFELRIDSELIIAGPHVDFEVNSNEEHAKVAGMDWLHRLQLINWPFDRSDIHAYQYKEDGTSPATLDDPPEGFAWYITARSSNYIIDKMLNIVLSQPYVIPTFTWTFPAVGNSIELFTVDLIDTESMYDKIKSLSDEEPGQFDFWVEPDKEIKMVTPRQYDLAVVDDEDHVDIQHIFDITVPESGLLVVNFRNSGPQYTRLLGQGTSQATNLVSTRQYEPAMDTFGRIEGSESFGNIPTQTRVSRITRKYLLFGLNPVHEISIVVAPEAITDFWTKFKPGRAIWLKADMEAHNIDSAQEIVSMDGIYDNLGNLTVTLRLNQIYASAGLLDD